jgi:hypothetical protein
MDIDRMIRANMLADTPRRHLPEESVLVYRLDPGGLIAERLGCEDYVQLASVMEHRLARWTVELYFKNGSWQLKTNELNDLRAFVEVPDFFMALAPTYPWALPTPNYRPPADPTLNDVIQTLKRCGAVEQLG